MNFDFGNGLDRRGTGAEAIEGMGTNPNAPTLPKDGFSAIPMWIADMNFPTAPSVQESIIERTKHPAFGYFRISDEYYRSIIDWHHAHFDIDDLRPEYIGYENSVLGGLVTALCAFTSPGDAVLVHSPTYIGFTNSIRRAGRRIVLSPLVKDEGGTWRMDYEDMERKIAENHIHVVVHCSPHNPTGRAWTREEQLRAAEVFSKHECTVICDEIWADLTLKGARHIPYESVGEETRRHTVALYAPSKTFNIAGIVGAYHVIYDKRLRDRMDSQALMTHYNCMNVLSMQALMGAYCETGDDWLRQLREALTENVRYAHECFMHNFSGFDVAMPEATYMLFIDCSHWCAEHGVTLDQLEAALWDVGVGVQDGRMFNGACHLRMNVALPKVHLEEALDRMEKFVVNK